MIRHPGEATTSIGSPRDSIVRFTHSRMTKRTLKRKYENTFRRKFPSELSVKVRPTLAHLREGYLYKGTDISRIPALEVIGFLIGTEGNNEFSTQKPANPGQLFCYVVAGEPYMDLVQEICPEAAEWMGIGKGLSDGEAKNRGEEPEEVFKIYLRPSDCTVISA